MTFYASMLLCVFTFMFAGFFLPNVFLKLINIIEFFVFILLDALAFSFSSSLPTEKSEQIFFPVTQNILRKKTFAHPLALRRNFITGTKRSIRRGQS